MRPVELPSHLLQVSRPVVGDDGEFLTAPAPLPSQPTPLSNHDRLLAQIDRLLGDGKERWKKQSIYKVPESLKMSTNRYAYRPELVSLGPFHHFDTDLLPMEEHKTRALVQLVKRCRPNKDMKLFVFAVKAIAKELAAAYGLGEEWLLSAGKKEQFVDMMLTDGCFLLEVMRMRESESGLPEYDPNDPIFGEYGYHYGWPIVYRDIILLENQLPLLLLQKIQAVADSTKSTARAINTSVLRLLGREIVLDNIDQLGLHPLHILQSSLTKCPTADDIVSIPMPPAASVINPGNTGQSSHVVEEVEKSPVKVVVKSEAGRRGAWTWRIPCGGRGGGGGQGGVRGQQLPLATGGAHSGAAARGNRTGPLVMMPNAEKMSEAGISFRRSSTDSLLHITFERGVLSMPHVEFDYYKEIMFLNLMAFERLHRSIGSGVTSYVCFMDRIIDTGKDVELLKSEKIIDCVLGSDEELAKLFNNTLNKVGLMSKLSELHDVQEQVSKHCLKPWNKWRANLIQTYFSNPWVIISLIAAVILLLATLLQTYYTVMPFYKS